MPQAAFEAYRQAVAYLESFITGPAEAPRLRDPKEQARLQAERLPRMAALLSLFGNPHQRYRSLHVAGTSGKGSTCAILGSVLHAAGYRVGVYTSPYLQTAIEKIDVDGRPISPHDFASLVDALRPVIEPASGETAAGPVAYAQLWAALTFAHFAQRQVDFAVVEVGMGGRFDYTNVLTPAVAGITNVSHDHLAALGPTLRDIAWHKAGIIKPGGIAVTGAEQPEVLDVIVEEALRQGARVTRAGTEINFHIRSVGPEGGLFDFRGHTWSFDGLRVGLLGEHQIANGGFALAMLEHLAEQGVSISEAAVREGLAEVRIPGRLEVIQDDPLVVLDGAHNPEKARRLREALLHLFPGRRTVLVLGMLSAKEADGILRELAPLAELTVATAPSVLFKPAVPPEELARRIAALGGQCLWEPDPRTALARALDAAGPDDLVCVTGSLYLVGAVREHWVSTDALLTAAARRIAD